ncbi:type IV secretion system protein [Helicobacter sp.]|uniref:type IV secretion system protein n=1 Tax=Helicobacter sp. TaxID=218 RepID=UPI002A909255|nr:type IV secretion system protein [Helicobacter sp.]MDY5556173.1 type IV secretion system protein [Helicobacter sp.]
MFFKEKKTDPNYLFLLERNLKAYMLYIILILALISTLLALALVFLMPLKETKPYLVFFSNGENNFVKVTEANYPIRSDEALMKNILSGYVLNRETINRINDEERYEITRIQSDINVWKAFQNLVTEKNSIYTTKNLYRNIRILNVTLLSKNVATIDFVIEQTNKTRTETQFFNYRASLEFDFAPKEDNTYNTTIKNPTGFVVKNYALNAIDIDSNSNESNNKKEQQ